MLPRILLALYGEHQLRLLSDLFGYEVRVPVDVMSTIHLSEEHQRRFDVLVLDAMDSESFEAAEYAKDLGWTSKVIFVSKVDELGLRLKASQIRCDAFLVLPGDLPKIKPLVVAIVEDL
jgi:hypothetical protein